MTLDMLLVAVGALGLVVAALSARLRRLPLSEPLLALVLGVLMGPAALGLLDLPPVTEDHTTMHEASRILLAVAVMAVALRYPFKDVRRHAAPVVFLLLVVMPAMALLSSGVTGAVLGVGLATALLVGTAICPTDPVLASSVVTGKPAEEDVPARDRQVLSLESGANDGLALPLVLVALVMAGGMGASEGVTTAAWQVLGAVVVGALAGWVSGLALRAGEAYGSTDHGPVLLFTLVLALTVLGVSGVLHLDGVLASFVAGLAFNYTATGRERTLEVSIDEAFNRFAVLPFFVYVGVTLPWREWGGLGWAAVAAAVLVLFLRRMPALLASKRPLGLGWADAAYLGWFGPVGVSAVFYLTLVEKEMDAPAEVLPFGMLVVVLSTVAHGLTSAPGRVAYRKATSREQQSARS